MNTNLDKKRWIILISCCLINLCIGSTYAWSVFSAAIADHFNNVLGMGITTGDLAIAYTVCNAAGPVTIIAGGWINDKIGPKLVVLIGGVLFGLGMFLSGFATSVGFLIVTYGLLCGFGLGLAYGSTISTCVKYFPDKRGLIGGTTTAVYGLSSVILPPVASKLISVWDVTVAFKAIGVVFFVVIIACSLILAPCPAGYVPTGYVPSKITANKSSVEDKTWTQMIKTPIFYVMLILLMCGAFSGMMIISQASQLAQNIVMMTPAAAAVIVSTLALFNAFGRLASGTLSDKIGRNNTLVLACVVSVCGLTCLYLSTAGFTGLFYVGICLVGISFGSFLGVYPGFTADQFGTTNSSVNYGIMMIGFALAGFFGPQIIKTVYASTGLYQNAFLIAGGLSVLGIILSFVYRKVNK